MIWKNAWVSFASLCGDRSSTVDSKMFVRELWKAKKSMKMLEQVGELSGGVRWFLSFSLADILQQLLQIA